MSLASPDCYLIARINFFHHYKREHVTSVQKLNLGIWSATVIRHALLAVQADALVVHEFDAN